MTWVPPWECISIGDLSGNMGNVCCFGEVPTEYEGS